jgi:hypothetical protein
MPAWGCEGGGWVAGPSLQQATVEIMEIEVRL